MMTSVARFLGIFAGVIVFVTLALMGRGGPMSASLASQALAPASDGCEPAYDGVVRDERRDPVGSSGPMPGSEVARLLSAYWRGEELVVAAAVAKQESGWNPTAGNRLADGRTHRGLMQISSLHAKLIAAHGGNRFHPAKNIAMAKVLYDESGGWGPWEAYTTGAHLKHMPAARAAVVSMGKGTAERCDAAPVRGTGRMTHPVPGSRMTSPFGMRLHPITGVYKLHDGIDFGAACGLDVLAADSGRVTWAMYKSGYGYQVKVDHGRGVSTSYSHLSGYLVASGDAVKRGQVIARVGNTGYSTGCHLHFMIYRNGEPVDPRGWVS